MIKRALAGLVLSAWLAAFGVNTAFAQQVGGAAKIAVTTSTFNVALPASTVAFPAVLLAPAAGTTVDIFYILAPTALLAIATLTSPALPLGGLCFYNVGPNLFVGAIVATGTPTLNITQLAQCPAPH
jgi:hypothetical protein